MVWNAEGFGQRLGAAMALVGIEPKALADKLGVDVQTVYNMLNGRTTSGEENPRPRNERLLALEILVRQPREWLLAGEGPPPTPLDAGGQPEDYERRLAHLEAVELDQERALRDLRHQLERIAQRLEETQAAQGP